MGTLQRHRIARCADVLPTFRAVCGTRDVNHATTVRASKLLQQYKTRGEVLAVWLRSLYEKMEHGKLDVDDIDALAGSRNKVWNQTKRVFRHLANRLSGISGSSHGQ
jgi:hypothetical protein